MATAISTVTKTASLVKTTKGSEKKWSEILSMNRRHDLQLPLDIKKYDGEVKRTHNLYQRQKYQTERLWTNKHQTWYQNDFLFRNQLLKQLKPITRRFKRISSSSLTIDDDHQQQQILNDDGTEFLSSKIEKKSESYQELPPIKASKKGSHFQDYSINKTTPSSNVCFAKLVCPKVLHDYEPRLYSHAHAPFLDIAQRFITRKPEFIEKGIDHDDKNKQQNRLKALIDNEQERTKLAAIKFREQLHEEKDK